MFIGHYALALAAKKFAPQVSLGILFLACQLADMIWPNLVLLGIETLEVEPGITVMTPLNFVHYPYSHSLVALTLWSALFGAVYALLRRSGTKVAIVLAVLVLSHWVLDVLTHRPDMPITLFDSSPIGFGLWNFPVVAVPLELLLFGAGIWLYVRQTTPLNRKGSIGFWALIVFLLVVYAAGLLGPPPPSATAVAWSGQALWLVIAWGFWIDHNWGKRSDQAN
jgi:membrane-bound metal-dependent hydrolase YbcI (DUF457 family)